MKNTHERIIAASKELFEKKGFAATTTKEIANLAEVSEVTLFRHFETKRNLFDKTLHSCIHPYKLKSYLANDVTYDLEHDLTYIAYNMMETYKQNLPMLRMIMKDKRRGSVHEMHAQNNEHCVENHLMEYFSTMRKLGKLSSDPDMGLKFFITNISGYFLRDAFSKEDYPHDEKYFAWMLKRVISILES